MEQPVTLTRELTLEEAVSFAIFLQQNQQFVEAHELYRRVLDTSPDHPRALHYAGVLAHQQRKISEAIELIQRSLSFVADEADWHSNLGIVFQSDGKLDHAIDAYRRAIAIDPSHANAHNNLGVLLRATGQPVEAEAAYRAAIRLNSEHIDAYTNLGILLNGLNRPKEAVACYCKVVTLRPNTAKHGSWRWRTVRWATRGSSQVFEEWLQEEPGIRLRSTCWPLRGRGVPKRASNSLVETTFDSFASSFESKLEKLSYRAPALVAAMLENSGLEPLNRLDVLDAGCGTGLCGTLVAPFASRLVGVDLSEKMLAQARDKQVYHALVKGELTEYLRANRETFDLIVSADALVYFGDLKGVAEAAAVALRPNGLFVFTLEHAAVDSDAVDYRLEVHGRYSHSRAYVEQLLMSSGLKPTIVEAELRMEAGAAVPGLVIHAAKST